MKKFILIMTTLALAISLTPVYAHTGFDAPHSFMNGLMHPWFGADHLLVLFGVGLYAATLKGRVSILLPLGFLLTMMAGITMAYQGFIIPAVEQSIVASLFIVGAMLIVKPPISAMFIFGLMAYFALCHGYVHALEIQLGESECYYLAGLILSSAFLTTSGRLVAQLGTGKLNKLQLSTGFISVIVATLTLAY